MTLTIRRYRESEYTALCSLEEANTPGECKPAVFIRQAGVLFPETFLVADRDGEVIGYTIGARVQQDPTQAWIIRLAVREKDRRQGVGAELVAGILAAFRSMSIREVFLSVSPANVPGRNLYDRNGFFEVDYCGDYFGAGVDRTIMKRTIE
ncbi:hypothetical protein ABH15_04060 [Methanoculleus taiwanensis]|uniref:N-acetyltransferase domain-containing protein n=1 Tax=Methanoculleus taiwanensis TaxID=1550565 RepID=A0A498H5A3_9EURY|nr:GNAT family N-acetyltransferase [Methanoculleus taiwanensis]RXE57285.1 hypothetical protein ABH15_04060 [Methanoculleus taiwanensis]